MTVEEAIRAGKVLEFLGKYNELCTTYDFYIGSAICGEKFNYTVARVVHPTHEGEIPAHMKELKAGAF